MPSTCTVPSLPRPPREVKKKFVAVPVSDDYKGDVRGPVTVQYVETYDDGAKTIAETQAVLR